MVKNKIKIKFKIKILYRKPANNKFQMLGLPIAPQLERLEDVEVIKIKLK